MENFILEPEARIEVIDHADVLVIGGGPAGIRDRGGARRR